MQAGAGFGKTTALCQAIEQNTLAPRGVDLWLGCEPADCDGEHLRRGLTTSLGLTGPAGNEELSEAISAHSPAQVCIVFDDVHEIEPGSSGAEVLSDLVRSLPSNAHLVLASRTGPPLNLARLEAQGQVERLTEKELTLNQDDLASLAARAGRRPEDVSHLGGWAALVTLGLHSGPISGFLNEEVLGSLDEPQRHLLSIIVSLGGVDSPTLQTLTGVDPAKQLANLPMVQHDGGWFRAHDLWREVFSAEEIKTSLNTHLRPAVEALLESGNPVNGNAVRAVDMALRSSEDDLIIRTLRESIISGGVEDPETLRRWKNQIPPHLDTHPLSTHIEGLLLQSTDPTTDRCRDRFERAAAGFAALGDGHAEVCAVAELGFWHHIQRDSAGLLAVAMRMIELADRGERAAAPYIEIIGGFRALADGDPHRLLASVKRARDNPMIGRFAAIADWLEYQARELLGDTSVELADRYLDGVNAIRGTEVIAISARWRAGHVEELIADPTSWESRSGSERARFLSHAWLAAVTAGTGDTVTARRHHSLATQLAGERGAAQVEISLGLPEALIVHEEGDLEKAEQLMRTLVLRSPIANNTRLSYNGSGSLISRIEPTAMDQLTVPLPDRDISLGLALRELDQTGELTAIAAVKWPERPGLLLSSLFLRTACEFVAAGWAAGRTEAAPSAEWLLEVIGDAARDRLRDHTEHAHPEVAKAAKAILSSVPLAPMQRRNFRLLGTEQLFFGDEEVRHDDWRRERVRSLFGYLVFHPNTTRDATMAAMWPEASEEAARRNLRSTLNLLLGVLEPGRAGGDAAYFVRADTNRVRLGGHDRLDVDVWRFDSLLDKAAQLEADGAPSLSLECLLEATELYRGELLASVHEGEWLHLERQRLHIRFVNAAVRASELLLAHDRADEAIRLANRAVKIEPWSEAAHRTLVAGHLQRNDRAAAHRAMHICREVLDELGGPVDELTEMLQRRLTER